MTLLELFRAVKEQNLTKEQLEQYHDQLSSLFSQMQLEMSDIEKEKAIYFVKQSEGEKKSDISIKRNWSATDRGQREIELKHYILATKEMINSLKSRTYRLIY